MPVQHKAVGAKCQRNAGECKGTSGKCKGVGAECQGNARECGEMQGNTRGMYRSG